MMKAWKTYLGSILLSVGTGALSALLTMGNMDIYQRINTPPLAPPPILFPIVWTVLYVLMGISAAMILRSKTDFPEKKQKALLTYLASLFFNFYWSLIFFNLEAFGAAFLWLCVLLLLVVKTVFDYFEINRTAAYLQIPYLLWVSFAGYLNFGIWLLNR